MNSERLQKEYDKQFQKFIDGYEIIFLEADDCDEQGIMYWAECKNGVGAREWNIEEIKKNDIKNFKKKIIDEGIVSKSKQIYYINPFEYFFKDKIEIISYEEYDESMKNRHKLESILDKYINYLGDEYKKVEHGNKWYSNSCKLSKKINSIRQCILTSPFMMKRTLQYNLKYDDYKKLEKDFKENKNLIKLTDEEIELWNSV